MKRQIFSIASMLFLVALIILVVSCKEDEDDSITFSLQSLNAGSIDLNGAYPANDVPTEPTITATFSLDVKASTVDNSKITLDRQYDGLAIDLTITVSGKTITIVPNVNLGNGAEYKLSFKAGIKSTDDQSLSPFERTFTTEGTFVPSGQVAHWGFEDNPNDDVGPWDPLASGIVDVTYVDSRNAAAGKAASFNGTTTIIEIPNGDQLMETQDFTLSFWAKAEDVGHGHFVIGLAAFYGLQFELFGDFKSFKFPVRYEYGDGGTGGGDMIYNGDGLTMDNGGWRGCVFSKADDALDNILKDKWFLFTYVYNSATRERSMFLNGELVKREDFDLWLDDDGNPYLETTIVGLKYDGVEPETYPELAFGFIHSRAGTLWDGTPWGNYESPDANHFKGLLDDVRIFHKVLTEQEIDLMYQSEKP